MSYCVFTAMTGSSLDALRDSLKPLAPLTPESPRQDALKAYCFTNLEAYKAPAGWTTILVDTSKIKDCDVAENQKNRMLARSIKLRPDWYIPSYTSFAYTMWVDGNVEFLQSPLVFFQEVVPKGTRARRDPFFASFTHHERTSMSQELAAIVQMRPDEIRHLGRLQAKCREVKFRDDMGLMETCVVIRSVNRHMQRFNDTWWQLLVMSGLRDQITLPVALHIHRETLAATPLVYRWRASEAADMHVMDWPKAPWVHRLAHTSKV